MICREVTRGLREEQHPLGVARIVRIGPSRAPLLSNQLARRVSLFAQMLAVYSGPAAPEDPHPGLQREVFRTAPWAVVGLPIIAECPALPRRSQLTCHKFARKSVGLQ